MAKPKILSERSRRRLPPNWRERLKVTRTSNESVTTFHLQFKDPVPKGFAREQGSLSVWRNKPHSVYVSEISPGFRFRGMGRLLYTHALKHFGQLSTHFGSASYNAQSLWKRLAKQYRYKCDHMRLTIYNKPKPKPKQSGSVNRRKKSIATSIVNRE